VRRVEAQHSPVSEPAGSPALAVPAALIAAVAGGVAWGLIVKWTEYEVGIVAWGIGFLTGTAVVVATRGGKGTVLQAIAIGSALVGILLGKYLSYAFDIQEQAEEAGVSLGLLSSEMRTFFREDLDQVFGLFDLLWVGFAVYTAWRVPQRVRPELPPGPQRAIE
jgi:hypothetical protein